jgi:anti-anti-sigma factor
MRISFSPDESGGRICMVAPEGDLDLFTAADVRDAIQDALRTPDTTHVIVDLDRVAFLACAGIGALVADRNTAVRLNRRYTVINQRPQPIRTLQLAGLLHPLDHCPEEDRRTGAPATRSDRHALVIVDASNEQPRGSSGAGRGHVRAFSGRRPS